MVYNYYTQYASQDALPDSVQPTHTSCLPLFALHGHDGILESTGSRVCSWQGQSLRVPEPTQDEKGNRPPWDGIG
jgi:hypothetical protein